jgi:hypothetical protein
MVFFVPINTQSPHMANQYRIISWWRTSKSLTTAQRFAGLNYRPKIHMHLISFAFRPISTWFSCSPRSRSHRIELRERPSLRSSVSHVQQRHQWHLLMRFVCCPIIAHSQYLAWPPCSLSARPNVLMRLLYKDRVTDTRCRSLIVDYK